MEVHGKPILRDAIAEVTVDAHDTLTLRLPMAVKPEPDVAIALNGDSLFADIRTTTEISDALVVVARRAVTKRDAGVYQIRLFNDFGDDVKEVRVKVNGEF
jgi:hypothetical protein